MISKYWVFLGAICSILFKRMSWTDNAHSYEKIKTELCRCMKIARTDDLHRKEDLNTSVSLKWVIEIIIVKVIH